MEHRDDPRQCLSKCDVFAYVGRHNSLMRCWYTRHCSKHCTYINTQKHSKVHSYYLDFTDEETEADICWIMPWDWNPGSPASRSALSYYSVPTSFTHVYINVYLKQKAIFALDKSTVCNVVVIHLV